MFSCLFLQRILKKISNMLDNEENDKTLKFKYAWWKKCMVIMLCIENGEKKFSFHVERYYILYENWKFHFVILITYIWQGYNFHFILLYISHFFISYFHKKIEVKLALTQECMFMFIIYFCILDILCMSCVEKLDHVE